MAQHNAGQQLNDLLITKNFDPQALDSAGKPAVDPAHATVFSFDYVGESGQDYGTVAILLGEGNDMCVYFGDNVGKSMEGDDKKGWFDFLQQLRQFAKRNLLSFSLQNLNKLKYSMQGQAAIKEGLFESWSGKRDVSWNAAPTEARLMIKHKRSLGETDARFRYIESLFIETAEGERWKMPFKSLSAGKAMLEHVRQGGRPYDARGNHIATIVEEMSLLSRFRRANQGKIFEGETQQLVEQATEHYKNLHSTLKSLSTKTGYKRYFESWNPADLSDEDVIIEDLRHMFIEQNIDSRIEQALPLLAKLKQESAMKEINVFEGWMNLLSEGTWALPDTPEKQSQLVGLLADELPVGPDATNATELLYDILGDDDLFDQLHSLAQEDANADARTVILNRLEQMKSNPAVAQVIGKLKIESTPQAEPAQAPQAEPAQAPDDQEPVQEMGGGGMQKVFHKGQWLPADQVPKDELMAVREGESCQVCHESECSCPHEKVEEEKDTVEKDPKTGEVKSWSHEGDWEKIPKSHGKAKDPRGEVTNMAGQELKKARELDELSKDTLGSYIKKASSDRAMRNFDQGVDTGSTFQDREPKFDKHNSRKDDQRRSGIHKAVGRLVKESCIMESGMSEVDILLQDIARGDVDIYNIYAAPKTNVEKFVSDQIHDRVEEISRERGIPMDDDIDKILQIIHADLEDEYGVDETVGGGNWLEETTALTGQYGHSGKLQAVKPVDQDMMDRLKFLAGVTK